VATLASSTHKLGKVGPKRQHTVTVHGLHVSQAPPRESEQLCNLSEPTYTYPSTSTLTLQDFFAASENTQNEDPSNNIIFYNELLDEDLDSNETIRKLAEILLENASSDHGGMWFV